MSFDDQVSRISKFAADRDWEQFHSVKNLIFALVGEVGELAESSKSNYPAISRFQ